MFQRPHSHDTSHYANYQPPSSSSGQHRKRRRATAVVVWDGRYLLVRDRGQTRYSLPGGGIERDEPVLAAAVREVYEETRLEARSARYLFAHEGRVSAHHVVLIEVRDGGKVRLQRKEIEAWKWWDRRDNLPVQSHVTEILDRLDGH